MAVGQFALVDARDCGGTLFPFLQRVQDCSSSGIGLVRPVHFERRRLDLARPSDLALRPAVPAPNHGRACRRGYALARIPRSVRKSAKSST